MRKFDPIVAEVARRLQTAADDRTRDWWQRYLRGAIPFRGVAMAGTRTVVRELWRGQEVQAMDRDERLELALRLFREPYAEDKLAGILALAEHELPELTLDDVPRLARPLAEGHVDDWSTCDWYCVKVVGPFVARQPDRRSAAEAVADWRFAERLWHRRAAAVSFANYARQGEAFFRGFPKLLLTVCETNVQDPARFSQTSVGWTLRELSRAEPERVARFVRKHRERMSAEAYRAATQRLPATLKP